MLIGFHVSLDNLHLLKLEVKFLIQKVFEKSDSIYMRISFFAFSINQMLVLANIEGSDLEQLLLKISHVLHCAFLHHVYSKVILDPYLTSLFGDLEMIDSTKQASALITDVLLASLSLHLHIEGLKLHWLSKSCMEPR